MTSLMNTHKMAESHREAPLTVNSDVDGAGLCLPDSSWDKEAGLAREMGIFVLLGHSVLQRAGDGVKAAVHTNC